MPTKPNVITLYYREVGWTLNFNSKRSTHKFCYKNDLKLRILLINLTSICFILYYSIDSSCKMLTNLVTGIS